MARKGIWIPCIILAVVWIAHILYFGFRVKTIPKQIQHENDERQLRAVSIDGRLKNVDT